MYYIHFWFNTGDSLMDSHISVCHLIMDLDSRNGEKDAVKMICRRRLLNISFHSHIVNNAVSRGIHV